jgi:hypothetical protein
MSLQDRNTQQSGIKRFVPKYILLGVPICLFKQLKPDPLFTTRWVVQYKSWCFSYSWNTDYYTWSTPPTIIWFVCKEAVFMQNQGTVSKRCHCVQINATNLDGTRSETQTFASHIQLPLKIFYTTVEISVTTSWSICRFRSLLFCTVHHLLCLSI